MDEGEEKPLLTSARLAEKPDDGASSSDAIGHVSELDQRDSKSFAHKHNVCTTTMPYRPRTLKRFKSCERETLGKMLVDRPPRGSFLAPDRAGGSPFSLLM